MQVDWPNMKWKLFSYGTPQTGLYHQNEIQFSVAWKPSGLIVIPGNAIYSWQVESLEKVQASCVIHILHIYFTTVTKVNHKSAMELKRDGLWWIIREAGCPFVSPNIPRRMVKHMFSVRLGQFIEKYDVGILLGDPDIEQSAFVPCVPLCLTENNLDSIVACKIDHGNNCIWGVITQQCPSFNCSVD